MPKINMEIGLTWQVEGNWVKATVGVSEIDTEKEITPQLKKAREGMTETYSLLIDEVEQKILDQIETGQQLVKKKELLESILKRLEKLEKGVKGA